MPPRWRRPRDRDVPGSEPASAAAVWAVPPPAGRAPCALRRCRARRALPGASSCPSGRLRGFLPLVSDRQAGQQFKIGIHGVGQLRKARPVAQRRQHQQGVARADPAIQRHDLIVAEIAARRQGHDEQIATSRQLVTALQGAEALAQRQRRHTLLLQPAQDAEETVVAALCSGGQGDLALAERPAAPEQGAEQQQRAQRTGESDEAIAHEVRLPAPQRAAAGRGSRAGCSRARLRRPDSCRAPRSRRSVPDRTPRRGPPGWRAPHPPAVRAASAQASSARARAAGAAARQGAAR